MPFTSERAKIVLTAKEKQALKAISKSRTEPKSRVERAQMILGY